MTHREAARAVADGCDAASIKGAAPPASFTRLVDEEFGLLMPASFMAEPKVPTFVDALPACISRAPKALLDGYYISQSGTVPAFSVPAPRKAGHT